MSHAPIQAVIFDLDGVLIDSEPTWREVEVRVLGQLGVPITEAACEQTKGLRIDAAVEHWFARCPWEGPSTREITARIVGEVTAAVADHVPLFPTVTAVRAIQHSPLGGAVATSSPRSILQAAYRRLHLDPRAFPGASAEDEPAGKPDPAVYLTAARKLGVPPHHCLAIEDSSPGVQAALAAGMQVIGVTPLVPAEGVSAILPHDQVASWLHAHAIGLS